MIFATWFCARAGSSCQQSQLPRRDQPQPFRALGIRLIGPCQEQFQSVRWQVRPRPTVRPAAAPVVRGRQCCSGSSRERSVSCLTDAPAASAGDLARRRCSSGFRQGGQGNVTGLTLLLAVPGGCGEVGCDALPPCVPGAWPAGGHRSFAARVLPRPGLGHDELPIRQLVQCHGDLRRRDFGLIANLQDDLFGFGESLNCVAYSSASIIQPSKSFSELFQLARGFHFRPRSICRTSSGQWRGNTSGDDLGRCSKGVP